MRKRTNVSKLEPIFCPNSMFVTSTFMYHSYIETTSNPSTQSFLLVNDVSEIISDFNRLIYSYDCEEKSELESFLSVILLNDKKSLIDLLLEKGGDLDTGFFKKFVSCYMFSDCKYDQELCLYVIRYCLNSEDLSLQKSGINLLSLHSKEDDSLVDVFKDHKFSQPYLEKAFSKAIYKNENLC